MNRGIFRAVSVFFACFLLFTLLTMPAAAQAKGMVAARTYPVPKEMYIFHVSRDGVLGFVPDLQNPRSGCAGFSCILYRSPALGAKFEPIKTFSRVNTVFSGPYSHQGTLDATGLLTFIWAKKQANFALYVSADAGRTWKTVPGTKRDSPCSPFVVVPDLVNPHQAYVIPATPAIPFYGEQPLSLNSFLKTKDGGVSWEQRSLPGKTPPAVEGLLFHPEEPKQMWVWRSSMGNWTGVQYSEDGGLTWQSIKVYGENRFYGAAFNPFTDELVVTGRQVISKWCKGKGEDLRGKCGLSERADFEAGPPLLSPWGRNVIFPIFFYKEKGGVTGAVYVCRKGEVKKIATFSVEQGYPVYALLSESKLYLSFMNSKGSGQVLEYPLPAASMPWWWPALDGALILGILVGFFFYRRASTSRKKYANINLE